MGEKEGVENIYFESGKIRHVNQYKNGFLSTEETFYENGQLREKFRYEDGTKIFLDEYDQDGNEVLVRIENNQAIVPPVKYNSEGHQVLELIYKGNSYSTTSEISPLILIKNYPEPLQYRVRATGELFSGIAIWLLDSNDPQRFRYHTRFIENGYKQSGTTWTFTNKRLSHKFPVNKEGEQHGLSQMWKEREWEGNSIRRRSEWFYENGTELWNYYEFAMDDAPTTKCVHNNQENIDLDECLSLWGKTNTE